MVYMYILYTNFVISHFICSCVKTFCQQLVSTIILVSRILYALKVSNIILNEWWDGICDLRINHSSKIQKHTFSSTDNTRLWPGQHSVDRNITVCSNFTVKCYSQEYFSRMTATWLEFRENWIYLKSTKLYTQISSHMGVVV